MRSLTRGSRLYYSLITSYYPTAAVGWILGGANCLLYLLLGAQGIRVPPHVWIAVYTDLAIVQFCLYASNRKHNVSPHESVGSSGVAGMFISVLTAPVYAAALVGSLLRRRSGFVVTPKGMSRSVDRFGTFRWHVVWGALFAVALGVSLWIDHPQSSMRLWSLTLIGVCITPVMISLGVRLRSHGAINASDEVVASRAEAEPIADVTPRGSETIGGRVTGSKRSWRLRGIHTAVQSGARRARGGQRAAGRHLRQNRISQLADQHHLLQATLRSLGDGRGADRHAGQRRPCDHALHGQSAYHGRVGQQQRQLRAGRFESVLWDPAPTSSRR